MRGFTSALNLSVATALVLSRVFDWYPHFVGDLDDATAHGVCVCNTPDAPPRSTAAHAITLLLSVAKELKRNDRELRRRNVTDFFGANRGIEIEGRSLGLVGLGRIGAQVATMARALGMTVTAYDPYVDDARLADLGVERAVNVEAAVSGKDVVSLHAPLTQETRHLINCNTVVTCTALASTPSTRSRRRRTTRCWIGTT